MKSHFLIFPFLFFLLPFTSLHGQGNQAQEAGKMFIENKRVFVVKPLVGIGCFDLSNPKRPRELAFIKMEGVVDIYVRASFLFASRYEWLTVAKFSLEDLTIEHLANSSKEAFPDREASNSWNPSLKIFPSYEQFLAKEKKIQSLGFSRAQGSMSCITMKGDYLYAINGEGLLSFRARITDLPVEFISGQPVPEVETIWEQGEYLYMGTKRGMFIYSLEDRSKPLYESFVPHIRARDPVVVQGDYAYVTTRAEQGIRRSRNELIINNVADVSNPFQVKRIPLSQPRGLSVKGKSLAVCEGTDGIRFFLLTDPGTPKEVAHFSFPNEELLVYEVIHHPKLPIAIVSTDVCWIVYDLSQIAAPKELTRFTL
ncbi:MAG: hypothetical protein AAF206_04405 [Bacteroidota bacterium]